MSEIRPRSCATRETCERIIDSSYIDYAIGKLGPFELQNKDSKLPGCR